MVAKLGERLAREQMNVLQTELALGALAASSNNEGGESLLKLIRASDTDQNLRAVAVKTFLLHIHGKWKHLKGSDQVRETIESLQKVPELLPFALEMITSCDRKEFQEALEQLANGQNGVGLSLRYAAIDGLSKFRNDTSVDVLVKLLHPIESPEIRQRVISSLGLLATEKALGILKTVLLNANSADFERMQALQSLASSRAGTTWLLAAQDRNELPEDLLAETGRLLRSSPHQDLRNKAHLVFPVKAKMDIRKLPSSHELAKQIGSADRGKLLVMNHKDLYQVP
ncbi:MAG TPA: HEAT repeat domain-containing protein [Gemmatales bacterium]|nr:HEAT repeat domain-containing protein [Gemmatales bacterium]